jgi:hypothetical protein
LIEIPAAAAVVFQFPARESTPAIMTDPNQNPTAPKKGWGCVTWLMIGAGIAALLMIIVGVLVMQAVNWVKNASVAVYPKLELSPGEREDVRRVVGQIDQAKRQGTVFEDRISPAVFNGVMERIIEDQRLKGEIKKDAQIFIRLSFESDGALLRVTHPAKDFDTKADIPGMYYNAEALFDLEIVEGELKNIEIKKLRLRGQEPPWLARKILYHHLENVKVESSKNKSAPENDLAVFKLLRRDGDRIHIIIDGKKMK